MHRSTEHGAERSTKREAAYAVTRLAARRREDREHFMKLWRAPVKQKQATPIVVSRRSVQEHSGIRHRGPWDWNTPCQRGSKKNETNPTKRHSPQERHSPHEPLSHWSSFNVIRPTIAPPSGFGQHTHFSISTSSGSVPTTFHVSTSALLTHHIPPSSTPSTFHHFYCPHPSAAPPPTPRSMSCSGPPPRRPPCPAHSGSV